MPRVVIKTGFVTPDGREEDLTDYLCDWPDCPNVATQVLACVRELGLVSVVCAEHAAGTGVRNATKTISLPPPDRG